MDSSNMILTRRHGDVLIITLNRPERLNATVPAMFEQLGDAIRSLDGARAILFAGNGRAFCSGADISGEGGGPGDVGERTYRTLTEIYNPVLTRIAELGAPIVSAVRGAAAGIGCSLALSADFCVASETAFFLQAFVRIGLVPDGGATWTLPRLVGKARAAEMLMLGERLPAIKALDWGLIHTVVPDDQLDSVALALAERLAAGPTMAMGLIRRAILQASEGSYGAAMLQEADNQRQACGTADFREGVAAFSQKRGPSFSGS